MSYFFYESKSGISFYQESVIIVSWFKLLCNYPKRLQRKHYEILGVNRFSIFYFTKIKTDGTPHNWSNIIDIGKNHITANRL